MLKQDHCFVVEIIFHPGGALLIESSEFAWAGRHRLVLLEGFRLLLSEGCHHDDTAAQLQVTPVAITMECSSTSNCSSSLSPVAADCCHSGKYVKTRCFI